MEKKSTKTTNAKKKAAPVSASKKKVIKKKETKFDESYLLAPEATPHVEQYHQVVSQAKASFWSKVKDFLGF